MEVGYASSMRQRCTWMTTVLVLLSMTIAVSSLGETPRDFEELGTSTVALDGPWQFHLGDSAAWAVPGFDDSGWEQLRADEAWDEQGHWAVDGYAWYRRHVDLSDRGNKSDQMALLIPSVGNVCAVYWNGKLVGRSGKFPPEPRWYADSSVIAQLGTVRSGVIAVRVWRAPFLSIGWNDYGGLRALPMIGLAREIELNVAASQGNAFRYDISYLILFPLYLLAAGVSLLAWLSGRRHAAYLWMAVFSSSMSVMLMANTPLGWHISVPLLLTINRAGIGVRDISLWYMLLWLLDLWGVKILRRLATAATVAMTAIIAVYVVVLLVLWPSAHARMGQQVEQVLAGFYAIPGFLSLAIVAVALTRGKRLTVSRWLLAISAVATQLLVVARNVSIVGLRFTHWHAIDVLLTPLVVVRGIAVHQHTVTDSLVLAALVFAFYRDTIEERRRHAQLEQEFSNAREVQQLLIPTELPPVPGYALTSAYLPSLEVGGDFFQIIPLFEGSTLAVVGDVSGKGLKAAMAVSLILGALQALAEEYPEPGELLEVLNERVHGHLQGAFATCTILRLESTGRCRVASAGHPPPWMNGRELELEGELPLGIAPDTWYKETVVDLRRGDQIVLFTDGLLEARNRSGELFGFGRLEALFHGGVTADRAAGMAVEFGQEDDITVLVLTVAA